MALYRYKAINPEGAVINGKMRADSRKTLISLLADQNLYPVHITEVTDLEGILSKGRILFNKVTREELSGFLRQLYTLFRAGIPITECIRVISAQSGNRYFKRIILEIQEKIEEGNRLSQAFSEHPDVFPPFLAAMVETGEAAGMLEDVLLKMSDFYRKEHRFRTRLRNATLYPKFLAALTLALVISMLAFIMPTFTRMFEAAGVRLPGITAAVMALGSFMRRNFIFVLLVLLLICGAFRYLKTREGFRNAIDRLKLWNPFMRHTLMMGMAGNFAGVLSMLAGSGISMIQALEIVSRVLNNKVGEEIVLAIKDRVDSGIPLSQAMEDVHFFPEILIAGVRTGEKSGALETVMEQISGFFEEELEKSLDRMIGILEPLMIVIMAIVIGFIVIAMIMPMFDMISALA